MKNYKLSIGSVALLALTFTTITGCSVFNRNKNVTVNEKLVIPPSLRTSSATASTAKRPSPRANPYKQTNQKRITPASYSKRNYYVVVGTYPSQDAALDTFTRLSSIGLPGATMESRKTKNGKLLHMVRLGPYQKQEDIDKVKDNLTNDGLSQFKVVED